MREVNLLVCVDQRDHNIKHSIGDETLFQADTPQQVAAARRLVTTHGHYSLLLFVSVKLPDQISKTASLFAHHLS